MLCRLYMLSMLSLSLLNNPPHFPPTGGHYLLICSEKSAVADGNIWGMLNLLLLRAFCEVALLTLGNISANHVPTIVDSVTKRPLHMFCWKLPDWGQELFSHFSRNFKRKLLSCSPAGKRPSRMNNWWCKIEAFPSVESRSNCELYYLEWRVRCVLSATPPWAFLPLLALSLQPFSSSVCSLSLFLTFL